MLLLGVAQTRHSRFSGQTQPRKRGKECKTDIGIRQPVASQQTANPDRSTTAAQITAQQAEAVSGMHRQWPLNDVAIRVRERVYTTIADVSQPTRLVQQRHNKRRIAAGFKRGEMQAIRSVHGNRFSQVVGTVHYATMKPSLFLTVVVVTRNQCAQVLPRLAALHTVLAAALDDHDILLIDNASDDGTEQLLATALREGNVPNALLLALAHPLSEAQAVLVGLENALGDVVVVFDLSNDPPEVLPGMVQLAAEGADVVYALASESPREGWLMGGASALFHRLYERIHGVNLAREAPALKLLSRRVVNYLLQDDLSETALAHLPAAAGFRRASVSYSGTAPSRAGLSALGRAERALRLLVASGPKPMRLVSLMCLFGAGINVLYSFYVVLIFLFKADVAPGWVTLSLQQSGMFFLISLVLLLLAEYVLIATRGGRSRLRYALKDETSASRITRREQTGLVR